MSTRTMREAMGVRERLNRNPRLAAIVMAVLLLVAGVAVALQFSDGAHAAGTASDKAFFTIDDGATWFADDAARIAPFQHDGKEAVRAYVFECRGAFDRLIAASRICAATALSLRWLRWDSCRRMSNAVSGSTP